MNLIDSVELGLKLGIFIHDVLILLAQEGSLFFIVDFKFHKLVLFFIEFLFEAQNGGR